MEEKKMTLEEMQGCLLRMMEEEKRTGKRPEALAKVFEVFGITDEKKADLDTDS
jgi:hypothetical protein